MLREWIKPGIIPLTLALLYACFVLLYNLVGLPAPSEIARVARQLYDQNGALVIGIAAFVEGIFMISLYLPGSFVILLGVVISDKTPASLFMIGSIAWIGFILAGFVNYYLGRYGYYQALLRLGKQDTVTKMDLWMQRNERKAVFLSAIHPNFLSVALVCCGIAGRNVFTTMSLSGAALVFWITLWILVVTPFLQVVDIEDPSLDIYVVIALVVWGIILIAKNRILPLLRRSN